MKREDLDENGKKAYDAITDPNSRLKAQLIGPAGIWLNVPELSAASLDRVVMHPRKIEVSLIAESSDDEALEAASLKLSVPWAGPILNPKRELLQPPGSPASARPMRSQHRTRLILALANARLWLADILERSMKREAIADREDCSERHVRMTLSLAFLAPDVIEAAVSGRLPPGLGITRLAELPMSWDEQRRQIGL